MARLPPLYVYATVAEFEKATERITVPFRRTGTIINTEGYVDHAERKRCAERGKINARKMSRKWMTQKDYRRQKALKDAQEEKPKAEWKPRKIDW